MASDNDGDRPWPSRFGTLGEAVFGKDDPFNYGGGGLNSNQHFLTDEIPPTRCPLDGKYYTSRAKIDEVYVSRGFRRVGDDWTDKETGEGDPTHETSALEQEERRVNERHREILRHHLNGPRHVDRNRYAISRDALRRYLQKRFG